MKKGLVKILCAGIPLMFFSSFAAATPFSPAVNGDLYSGVINGVPTASDKGTVSIADAINSILGTSYRSNHEVDHMFVGSDSVWRGLSGQVDIVSYSAWYSNTLGTYDSSGEHQILQTSGNNYGFDANPVMTFSIPGSGKFGWYLKTSNPNNGNTAQKYYSDANRNADGFDHMMTFDLGGPVTVGGTVFKNPYVLAWEDMALGYYDYNKDGVNDFPFMTLGDENYNDIVFLVDATPVPEPASMLLFGTGLSAIVGLVRKKKRESI